jgi:hypothetical protein
MKTASPSPTLAAERCQYRTPTGRQCASRILDPESSYCPRHSASQPPDSRNFSALLTENACDFQDPQGINHSLAALYKLLASGRISTRRATGLAYIASLLLRTLPGIREQIIETTDFSQFVPARGRVGCSDDEKPPIPPKPTWPGEPTTPEEDNPQGFASRTHASQKPPAPAPVAQHSLPPAPQPQAPETQSVTPPTPPSNFSRLPAVPGLLPVGSTVWPGPEFSRSPFPSVPVFRRSRPSRSWKPRFDAAAPGAVHRAYASDVQLAPPQLRLAGFHYPRRQTDRINLFRRFSAADVGEHSAREIRRQMGRSISYLRGRLNIADAYCGYCLTLVTRVPVKRTNTVFDGG